MTREQKAFWEYLNYGIVLVGLALIYGVHRYHLRRLRDREPYPDPLPEGEGVGLALWRLSQRERGSDWPSPREREGRTSPLPLGEGWGEGPEMEGLFA